MKKEQFCNLTEQICEAWEMDTPAISFIKKDTMKDILAMVYFGDCFPFGLMAVNTELLNYSIEDIMQVIYHELAHLITEKGDDDPYFQLFCKINNIPLSGEWEEKVIC